MPCFDRKKEPDTVWLCLCAVDDPSTGSACDDPKLSPNDAALDTSSRPTCRRATAHPEGQSSRWNVSAPSGSWCGPPNGPAAMHVSSCTYGSPSEAASSPPATVIAGTVVLKRVRVPSIFLIPKGSRRVLRHAASQLARHEDPARKRTRCGPPAGARRQLPDDCVEHADRPVRHGVVGRAGVDAHQQLREWKAPAIQRGGAPECSRHAAAGAQVVASVASRDGPRREPRDAGAVAVAMRPQLAARQRGADREPAAAGVGRGHNQPALRRGVPCVSRRAGRSLKPRHKAPGDGIHHQRPHHQQQRECGEENHPLHNPTKEGCPKKKVRNIQSSEKEIMSLFFLQIGSGELELSWNITQVSFSFQLEHNAGLFFFSAGT
jgi:hypothetical protein